ncbi:MAG: prolyl oligopeptidase family serine peptidase [Flavobacteriales bacterium]|nr:prolyl oligopeptidase family serine peptidase [Flavobacteriales bacterium]
MKHTCVVFILVITSFFLVAQTKLPEKRWFVSGQDTLPYLLHTPSGTSEKYPLVIWLHGKGERGKNNQSQFQNGVEILLDSMLLNTAYQGYLLIPQCGLHSTWSYYDKNQLRIKMAVDAPPVQHTLMALINDLLKNEKIDRQRIYLFGISMGGFGVWDIAMRYPEIFAAIVPICGGADPTKASLLKQMPVWAFHGEKDQVVSFRFTLEIMHELESLQCKQLDSRFSLLKGVGHNAWDFAMKEPGLLTWVFSKKRN